MDCRVKPTAMTTDRSTTRRLVLFTPAGAFGASAAGVTNEQIEIFTPVVERDLLPGRDGFDSAQNDLATQQIGFGIRPARMIGVTREVAAVRPVDRPAAIDLEH